MVEPATTIISKRNSSSRQNETPAIVHALAGSIGSALALVLFYPLERARIEMQSDTAAALSAPAVKSPRLGGKTDISLIRCADVSQSLTGDSDRIGIEDEASWDHSPDSPTSTSWSINSCPMEGDGNTVSSLNDHEDSNASDNVHKSKDGIVRCLVDLRERGVLYTGVKPIISTIFASQFLFFFLQAYAKEWLMGVSLARTKSPSPWLSLSSSCLAGVCNVLLTNPLWVTNMAIISGATDSQNLFGELLKLLKERGPRQLWKGTGASLLLVSNPIIQFVCYDQFKRICLASKVRHRQSNIVTGTLGPIEAFVIAALAKAIATVSTYPLQLSQTLLRLSRSDDRSRSSNYVDTSFDIKEANTSDRQQQKYEGTVDCLIQLYSKNNAGCSAWFTGMKAKLLQTVLTSALTFLTYEQILGVVKHVAFRAMLMQQYRTWGKHRKEL